MSIFTYPYVHYCYDVKANLHIPHVVDSNVIFELMTALN